MKLIKRQFLGTTCFHFFKSDTTGNIKVVEGTDEEYNNLANETPKLKGYTWYQSGNGMIKVDTPKRGEVAMQLDWNEYCDYEDGHYILTKSDDGEIRSEKVSKDTIVNDTIVSNKLN